MEYQADIKVCGQDDVRRAMRFEAQTEKGQAWLIDRAGITGRAVNGWWLFGGLDVQPETGAQMIEEMRAAGLKLNGAASPSAG